ncbi:MAG TPA: phage major capsid protein [Arthrobacter sp.]
MTTAPFTLAGTNQALLPTAVSSKVWDGIKSRSVIPALSDETPVIFGENVIPTIAGRPAAGIVGEGGKRPGGEFKLDAKKFHPVTAAVIVEMSKQSIRVNPANMMQNLQAVLTKSLTNAVDLAVIHGRNAITGELLTNVGDYLAMSTQRIELDPETGKYDKQLWDGYEMVLESDSSFNGFAFDPRFAAKLGNARDTLNRQLNPQLTMNVDGLTNYSGHPTIVSKGVSGQIDFSADQGVRAIGGDWNALKFGFNDQIHITEIPWGDPLGNGDLPSRGMTSFMAEVTFGWAVMDLNSFVLFDRPEPVTP